MAHDYANEQGRDGSAVPTFVCFEIPLCGSHNGSTQTCSAETTLRRRKSPIQALCFFNLGLYIACFPLLIYKQIFSHLAALSTGQQSKPFGFKAERAKPTLNFSPQTLGTPFRRSTASTIWQAAPLPSAWRTLQRAQRLLNIAEKLSKHLQPG